MNFKNYRRPNAHKISFHQHPKGTFVLARSILGGPVKFLGRMIVRIVLTPDGPEIRQRWK